VGGLVVWSQDQKQEGGTLRHAFVARVTNYKLREVAKYRTSFFLFRGVFHLGLWEENQEKAKRKNPAQSIFDEYVWTQGGVRVGQREDGAATQYVWDAKAA
jgi:hypothetical protein